MGAGQGEGRAQQAARGGAEDAAYYKLVRSLFSISFDYNPLSHSSSSSSSSSSSRPKL